MGEERFKRLIILVIVGGLIVFGVQRLVNLKKEEKKPLPSPNVSMVREKIEDFGDKILGQAIEMIPGYPKDSGENQQKTEENEEVGEGNQSEEVKENKDSEKESKEANIIQTEKIIEILKQLPQQELERIKKEVFKEFCRQVLEE